MDVHIWEQPDPASVDGRAWEQLVQATPQSGFMQSLPWAAFKRARGLQTVQFVLTHDSQLIGGMVVYAPTTQRSGTLLIAPHGPVIPWDDPTLARKSLQLLREAAGKYAHQCGAIGLRIEPQLSAPRPALLRDWGRAPVDLLAQESLYLELDQPAEALLAALKPKCRYNIRLAARRGVQVRSSTNEADIPTFYSLLDEAGERDGFYVEPIDHFSDLLQHLASLGHAQLLFAEHHEAVLGAMLLVTYGQRATYLYGGTANVQRNLMGGYALQWAAIQAAQAAHCSIYDFYGYEASGDPRHQYANFSRFKRSFGGTPVTFVGAHDFYWPDRVADVVIKAVSELSF